MKIHRCSEKAPVVDNTKPKTLSWDEIKDVQGIYKVDDGARRCSDSLGRILVLNYKGSTAAVHLWYGASSMVLEPLAGWARVGYSFVLCEDEEICFEIKKL